MKTLSFIIALIMATNLFAQTKTEAVPASPAQSTNSGATMGSASTASETPVSPKKKAKKAHHKRAKKHHKRRKHHNA